MRCDNCVEVKFGLLGRLEVVDGGRDAAPRRRKQRALLALLLLRAGEMVTVPIRRDAGTTRVAGSRVARALPPATASIFSEAAELSQNFRMSFRQPSSLTASSLSHCPDHFSRSSKSPRLNGGFISL